MIPALNLSLWSGCCTTPIARRRVILQPSSTQSADRTPAEVRWKSLVFDRHDSPRRSRQPKGIAPEAGASSCAAPAATPRGRRTLGAFHRMRRTRRGLFHGHFVGQRCPARTLPHTLWWTVVFGAFTLSVTFSTLRGSLFRHFGGHFLITLGVTFRSLCMHFIAFLCFCASGDCTARPFTHMPPHRRRTGAQAL